MPSSADWQVQPKVDLPHWFLEAIQQHVPDHPDHKGERVAQLLWQRGVQTSAQLPGFLNPDHYQPTSPFAFGPEMHLALQRLQQAHDQGETVAIWGDFDADGITATAVLWEGLGQFFTQNQNLFYTIPNRLRESHGLSRQGIEQLANQSCSLIVTCDTGSTNLEEINYAQELGIDLIVTDHHTLPEQRPNVAAIINPRSLDPDHPLFHLSGVAVAYKLMEALYQVLPEPQQPVETLLDLVAIGLIADLVQLKGDCRYLAQRGLETLQAQLKTQSRPGVAELLRRCKKNGDRPTDISFGIGPRINAVSRIQGDARFCVELLTSQDQQHCQQLARETEWANTRRKALQKDIANQVKEKLAQLDLSTTSVIVLWDSQWPVGVLGLVAGQIAQEYSRPVVLLSTDALDSEVKPQMPVMARGSARSVNQIDLYQLVKDQGYLLDQFGGHPFAAGLSLPVENLPLFTEAINQQLRSQIPRLDQVIQVDLVVTVAELGKALFQELKLLEPCGMGNPAPRLLIQNCWFEEVWNRNIKDPQGGKLRYIKTEFELWDHTATEGFPGIWWEHYKEDIPQGRCDVVVELDFNTSQKCYQVRLLAVRSSLPAAQAMQPSPTIQPDWILDWRQSDPAPAGAGAESVLCLQQSPGSWQEVRTWFQQAQQAGQKLAIAYPPVQPTEPLSIWEQLVGIAKYLQRTSHPATRQQFRDKLNISDACLQLGFQALPHLGFDVQLQGQALKITQQSQPAEASSTAQPQIDQFLAAVQEEQFRRQYFAQVPLRVLQQDANP